MIPEVPSNPNHSMTLFTGSFYDSLFTAFPIAFPRRGPYKAVQFQETSSDPESKCTGHNYVASSIPKVTQENCRESFSVYKCGVSHGVCHLVKHFSAGWRSQLSWAKATCGRENAIKQYKLSWKQLEPVPWLFLFPGIPMHLWPI